MLYGDLEITLVSIGKVKNRLHDFRSSKRNEEKSVLIGRKDEILFQIKKEFSN